MVASPVRDELVRRHLSLPAHVPSSSLLTWDAIAEVGAALQLSPGRVLLDLACGRGGYGLEVAHRTGAQLIGVDFSGEAVRQARHLAHRLGRAAVFQVGDLTATGLTDESVNAVMCVDAVQFAKPSHAVYEEIRRVLTPGGPVVLTCWEPVDPSDDRLLDRLRAVDLRAGLTAAGFVDVTVQDRPDWQTVERGLWREAAMLDPGADPALKALHDEGVRVLQYGHLSRRVMATATAA
jgi:SAM-dependent methyltransferase